MKNNEEYCCKIQFSSYYHERGFMQPIYITHPEQLMASADALQSHYTHCTLCAHKCGVDRRSTLGHCGCGTTVQVALFKPFFYEEPPISGTHGAGNIFFSGCNLKCVFCQNHVISHDRRGAEISIEELADIFLFLQNEKHVHNINLVTPTPYLPSIAQAIVIASAQGFFLPIVYNTNSYESPDIIPHIASFCDIFLPDYKYADESLAMSCSSAPRYPDVALETIEQMYHTVGVAEVDTHGILQRGTIIRHLVLPGYLENTYNVLTRIRSRLGKYIPISLMAQYTPVFNAHTLPYLDRALSQEEYDKATAFFLDLGFENGYFQSLESAETSYIPEFFADRTQLFSHCRV